MLGSLTLLSLCLVADFSPAFAAPGRLLVFPGHGKLQEVPLTGTGMPVFGSDGRTIYYSRGRGLRKFDLQSRRDFPVDGSEGLWRLFNLRAVGPAIFVSGYSNEDGCGTFELNPSTGTRRKLLAGPFPDCGGGGGSISPDGKEVLHSEKGTVTIVKLDTGESRPFLNDVYNCDWSPDGRKIACTRAGGKITVIDAQAPYRGRNFGASGGFAWSPDSRKLLYMQSQFSCMLTFYFESLGVLDVATGKHSLVKSSHCEVSGGFPGWVDRDALQ